MIELSASKGLGDAIYMRAIVLHLLRRGEQVTVFTAWAEVFDDLPVTVRGLAERTGDEDWRHAKPCLHCRIKAVGHLDAFTMACLQAGIEGPVPLRMDWRVRNIDLVQRVKREAAGRPILLFQPLKKSSNMNQALARPKHGAFAEFLAARADHFRVKVGRPQDLVPDAHLPCDLDLMGRTSVQDVFDIGTVCDTAFGESCFVLVMAEAMDKPFTWMFSRRGIESGRTHVQNIRPGRVFHKRHLATAVFDEPEAACAS